MNVGALVNGAPRGIDCSPIGHIIGECRPPDQLRANRSAVTKQPVALTHTGHQRSIELAATVKQFAGQGGRQESEQEDRLDVAGLTPAFFAMARYEIASPRSIQPRHSCARPSALINTGFGPAEPSSRTRARLRCANFASTTMVSRSGASSPFAPVLPMAMTSTRSLRTVTRSRRFWKASSMEASPLLAPSTLPTNRSISSAGARATEPARSFSFWSRAWLTKYEYRRPCLPTE